MRGHVRKRGKLWSIVVDVGHDEFGKRKQKWYSGFKTRKEAESKLNDLLVKLNEGTYVPPSKMTVEQYLTKTWLPAIRGTLRPNSLAAYEGFVRNHIVPAIGPMALQRVTPAALNALYADLADKGRKKGTGGLGIRSIRYCHTTLHRAFADAVKWGLLQRSPAAAATPPRQTARPEMNTWTAAELRTFLTFIEDERYAAAYRLLASTGARRGEILGLRWRDCDLDAGRLAIQQTIVAVGYRIEVSAPKTAKGRRSVALDGQTLQVLRTFRAAVLEERLALGRGKPADDELVFQNIDGSPVHPQAFSDRFERLAKAAGLPKIRLHDLRHSHATLALQAGIPAKVVSDRLGHATTAITLDLYSHVSPQMQEEAADRIAALVFGA